jgi:transcriptional regulator with XRE-family HTH domain
MEQLKKLRTERNLSQARLAARAGLDPSTVNQIERGARAPSPGTLYKLAEALGVGIAELLENEAPKDAAPPSLERTFNNALEEEERREELRRTEELFLEAYSFLKDLSEMYSSAGDPEKLAALAGVAALSGYGAIQHAEEEADIENLDDEETLELAMRAISAAGKFDSLLTKNWGTGMRNELAEKRRKKAQDTQRVLHKFMEAAN